MYSVTITQETIITIINFQNEAIVNGTRRRDPFLFELLKNNFNEMMIDAINSPNGNCCLRGKSLRTDAIDGHGKRRLT